MPRKTASYPQSIVSDENVRHEVNRILAGSIGIPKSKLLSYLKSQIAQLPEEWQAPVSICISLGKQIGDSSEPSSISLLWLGVALLSISLLIYVLVVWIGPPGLTQNLRLANGMLMIIFSLGTGFVGAWIPGKLNVKTVNWLGMRVDAASGLALFFITLVFLYWLR